ncbi:hypothetical protein C2845_PM05G30400 [Panicum miliaceum]|uniref:RING-type E3 ubiquitin transferase n=1 Tax=Panicum miliaceum TaxID=4540 RepID=A0A3L6T2P1_PANMI|nr:hypothetical protein C2845_PM05G30400 [Panicum miliaceum]
MACDGGGGGGGSPGAERRRVALRALLAGGEASSSVVPPAAAEVVAVRTPSKGLLRGLRCTSAAASQAIAPATAVDAARPSADWRSLGCTTAAAQAHAPAAAVDAAWRSEERRGRRRRSGRERRKARGAGSGGGGVSGGGGGMGGDVWCTPGIPFAAEASSVDCVVAPQQTAGARRRADAERPRRERPGAPPARRITMREHMSSSPMNSPPHHDMLFIDADRAPSGRNRHTSGRRHSHARLEEEMMMFRTRILLGRMGMYDQYQDWRLDVDNMTYEELLDLEDRIGYEEFKANEETGKLSCRHSYHVHCIKQWLSQKNACPVCKTTVSKT